MDKMPVDIGELEAKAGKLKVMAHPIRLCIVLGLLGSGNCNVTKIQSCLNMPQSTVSQHLARLREAGIVGTERNGIEVFYKVVDTEAIAVAKVLFSDILG